MFLLEFGPLLGQLLLPLRVEVEDRFALEVFEYLPAARALKLRVLGDRGGPFDRRVVLVEQPAAQPAQGGFSARLGEAVRVVVLEAIDALAVAQHPVDQLRLAEGGPRSLDVEEVARAGADQRRPRRP